MALSHSAVVASARATLDRLGGPGQWLLALPAHYVAGLQVLTRSILSGSSPVVLDRYLALAVAEMSGDRRYVAVVPTQLHRWLAEPSETAALCSFDAVLVGGGALAPELRERALEQGVRVISTYGMTETAGGCVYDGLPLDGVEVLLAAGGAIRLSGPVLFDGYVGQPELTASVLHGGWLHTPDLGRIDLDGRLEVMGRRDDVVVSGGVNVPLPAVEACLLSMPGLAAAAVVSVPDPEWGARVVAVVVPCPDEPAPDLQAVRDFVGAEHPRTWAPREVVVVDALPMLDSGKVDRQSLLSVTTGLVCGDEAQKVRDGTDESKSWRS